jgi:hypothetical protein
MSLVEERVAQGSIKATNFPSTSAGMIFEENPKVDMRLTGFAEGIGKLILPE